MTRIILIRHGQTEWNLKKKYCGLTDIGLSNKGRLQSVLLRRRFKNESIDKAYSSDRKRAIETARIAFSGHKIEKVADLKEMHFGVFEGLTYSMIMKKYPQLYSHWLKDPFGVNIPQGEELPSVKRRVVKAMKKIVTSSGVKTIAVVCHGGVISVFLNHILKSRNFWKYISDSSGISIVEYANGRARLRSFNDTSHLLKSAKSYNYWRNSSKSIKE
ncbi:MAG: histidine phosphatase family protein [Candidatus Omnitrophica bacterium]|nr:histidine phosphatase family protein [Candidatus Omnitrophota bacterium]